MLPGTNSTLDSNPATFPTNMSFYADFSHDNNLATLLPALGLDWAQATAARVVSSDPWERLLIAGLARDFQQLRLEFLGRTGGDPQARVDDWLAANAPRVTQFRALVDRIARSPGSGV